MFSSNSGKRSAKHITKKIPKNTIQATDEVNKKLYSRDQTFHKLEKKLPSYHKNEDICANEGMGKVLQKPQIDCNIMHIMTGGKPFHKTSLDEVSKYLTHTKCDACLKLDYENSSILSNKLQNDLRSLACLLKDYIVVNNYSPEKMSDLEKLNESQMSAQEKYKISKLFELVLMEKSKSANEGAKEELQTTHDNLKTSEICDEKYGKQSNEITQEADVSNFDNTEEKDEKYFVKDEKCAADGMNPSIQVIMPPNLNKSGEENIINDQNTLEVISEYSNILSAENEYTRLVNNNRGNYGKCIAKMTATASLKHKTISAPQAILNKDSRQIHNHQSKTKSSYIEASHYGSEKLSHLRSRLIKKLCNSRNIPEILKYKLYLAKLPVRVVLSNIYPHAGNEIHTTKPENEKNDTVSSKVKKTLVKSLTNITSNNANENKTVSQKINIEKEMCNNFCPMDSSVTEIIIGNTNEEELSNLFGRERKNKFERFCEFVGSTQSCINEHKSCSILHLFEKLCKNKSTLLKIKGNNDKEENHKICLKKSHSVETSKPVTKPKIKLEVHIPRVPANCDESTEESKKQNDFMCRGSNTQIYDRQDSNVEKTVGGSQTRDEEFKKQVHKSHSLQQHISGKIEEAKGKTNTTLSKISKRSKVTGKVKTAAIMPRMNKKKPITNETILYSNITQKDEIKDEKYWKNKFYKKLVCVTQEGITENDSLNEILNQVVSVIKFHWGKCLSGG